MHEYAHMEHDPLRLKIDSDGAGDPAASILSTSASEHTRTSEN